MFSSLCHQHHMFAPEVGVAVNDEPGNDSEYSSNASLGLHS